MNDVVDMTGAVETVVENIPIIAMVLAGFYAIAIICAVREISASRTSQGSIAWLVSLAFLPFPTTIIYLVFGWKHFDSYARTRMQVRASRLIRSEDLAVIDRDAGAQWPVQRRAAGKPFPAEGYCLYAVWRCSGFG